MSPLLTATFTLVSNAKMAFWENVFHARILIMGHFLLIILNKDTYGMKFFYFIADEWIRRY